MSIPDVSGKSIAELFSLRGRVAVVTGAAQGLGKAAARRLAEAGASVVIGDVDLERADVTVQELRAACNTEVLATRMDVADTQSVIAGAEVAQKEFGGLDIWVNNAGVYPNIPILDMTDDEWDRVMAVNLRGVFVGSREAARRMVAAGSGGVIVNVSSLAGFRGVSPGLAAYSTSKHGVRGATRQMALELAPHGIRVLAVAPGFARTEGNVAMLEARPEIVDMIPTTRASRLGRVGEPDDIARVILFCASDMSLFMSGDTLLVDGAEAA